MNHPRSTMAALVLAATVGARHGAAQEMLEPADPRPLVGVLLPLSGTHEDLGFRARAVVNLAWTEHQGARILFYDTQGTTPEEALHAALSDGAVALLGPLGDLESEAVAVRAQEEGVPLFTLSGAPEVSQDRSWVFRLRTTPLEQATALGAVADTLADVETLAILAPDDRYGDLAVLGFVRGAAETGVRVTHVVRYEANEPDVSDAIRELAGRRTQRLHVPSDPWTSPPRQELVRRRGDRTRPDALFIPDYARQISSILPFLEFQGWLSESLDEDVHLLGLSGWAGYELTFVGGLAAGATITQVFHHDDGVSGASAWTSDFVDVIGDAPLEWDAQVFDAAGFVFSTVSALPRNQRTRADVIRTLEAMPAYEGMCGPMWTDVNGVVVRDVRMWEVDGAGYFFPIATIHPPSLP